MKIFDEKLFEKVKDILLHNNELDVHREDDIMFNDMAGYLSICDGASYDGFISFTDGYLEISFYCNPKRDFEGTGRRLSGVNPSSHKRAKFLNKIIQEYLDYSTENDLKDYYEQHKEELEFEEFESFKSWYNTYIPYQTTPGLFGNMEYVNHKYDTLIDDVWNYLDSSWDDSTAFEKVRICLYEENGKYTATVKSFFNDDFNYGRERVGAWAGKGRTGEGIGDHIIYGSQFTWKTPSELYRKLKPRIEKAYQTL